MNPQFLLDGLLNGAMIGLGAVGLTLAYSILRFANFAHGEFASWGAYAALFIAAAFASDARPIGDLTFGWPLILATPLAMAAAGWLAWLLDAILFRRLRRHGAEIVLVIASFGASLALRSLLEFFFTAQPRYFSREIPIAMPLGFGLRATADQLFLLATAFVLMAAVHVLMTRTRVGRAMRAVSENAALASVSGIDVSSVVRATWLIGGALAGAAGIFLGLTVQLRPTMGFELLLPLFAAAILGGVGSVPGAMLGGLAIGVAEALAVPLVGAEYRAGVGFAVLLAVLLVRPAGLFGRSA